MTIRWSWLRRCGEPIYLSMAGSDRCCSRRLPHRTHVDPIGDRWSVVRGAR